MNIKKIATMYGLAANRATCAIWKAMADSENPLTIPEIEVASGVIGVARYKVERYQEHGLVKRVQTETVDGVERRISRPAYEILPGTAQLIVDEVKAIWPDNSPAFVADVLSVCAVTSNWDVYTSIEKLSTEHPEGVRQVDIRRHAGWMTQSQVSVAVKALRSAGIINEEKRNLYKLSASGTAIGKIVVSFTKIFSNQQRL